MTPEKARTLISAYYSAFNAKDWARMLEQVSDDIHHDVNEGGRRGGKARFADFIAHMDDCYDELLTDITIMTNEDGSRGAAEFIVNGTYKKTDSTLPEAKGQSYRLHAGAFLEVKDDKITRVTTYYNLSDWIAQVSA